LKEEGIDFGLNQELVTDPKNVNSPIR
jgi:hypothetical protein